MLQTHKRIATLGIWNSNINCRLSNRFDQTKNIFLVNFKDKRITSSDYQKGNVN